MKYFVVLFFFIFSLSVNASLDFKLNNDNSLFLCNVGVGQKRKTIIVCFDVSGNSCTEGSEACVCSSTSSGNISATLDVIDQFGKVSNKLIKADGGQHNSAFSQSDAWNNRIENIDLKFSSDHYLSDYFLDFCYVGPQPFMDLSTGAPVDTSEGNYVANVLLTLKDATSGAILYGVDSGLIVEYQLICDLRKEGLVTAPRGPAENSPSGEIETDFINGSSSPMATGLSLFTSTINDWPDQVPRFCIVRTWFKETNENGRRVNSLSISDFTLDITIAK